MKVFISSLITGFEQERQAVKDAVVTLRHHPVTAEEFGAQPNSPQVACLQGLRQSDLVVLVLGEGYGPVQPGSSLSATHEEYREARGRKPVIAFVQQGVSPGSEQAAFIGEVQGWEGGLFRGSFRTAQDLQIGVTRALHDYDLANAIGPVDLKALGDQAVALLGSTNRNSYTGTASLRIAVVGGPLQQVLRPIEIETPTLADSLHQAALFGETQLFDRTKGVKVGMVQTELVLSQEREAEVKLGEQGSVVFRLPLDPPSRNDHGGYLPVLLEEVVQQRLATSLGYASWLLERIDPTQRLIQVAVAARIEGGEHLAWRSEREPRSGSIILGSSYGQERPPIQLNRPRAALRLERTHLVEDLLVPLRRQYQTK